MLVLNNLDSFASQIIMAKRLCQFWTTWRGSRVKSSWQNDCVSFVRARNFSHVTDFWPDPGERMSGSLISTLRKEILRKSAARRAPRGNLRTKPLVINYLGSEIIWCMKKWSGISTRHEEIIWAQKKLYTLSGVWVVLVGASQDYVANNLGYNGNIY